MVLLREAAVAGEEEVEARCKLSPEEPYTHDLTHSLEGINEDGCQ